MTLKVIGAGFGRTGTESLKRALETLGLGPTHHMYEVMDSPVQRERWNSFASTGKVSWSELFEGFTSAVDWPSAAFWRQTMDFFPDAKVVLSHRPAEEWWNSFSTTIRTALTTGKDVGGLGHKVITEGVFGGNVDDKDHVIGIYKASLEEVRRTVPANRLIDLPLGSGWEPLCTGLGVAVPNEPYPYGNSQSQFRAAE